MATSSFNKNFEISSLESINEFKCKMPKPTPVNQRRVYDNKQEAINLLKNKLKNKD